LQVGSASDIYGYASSTTNQQSTSLDKDAFLLLFVEQLKNQDPTSPQDANTMINQMTQFGILEQLYNICADIAQIGLSLQVGEASALVGKQVTVQTSEGEISGQVEKVSLYNEEARIFIDGIGYEMAQVTEIK